LGTQLPDAVQKVLSGHKDWGGQRAKQQQIVTLAAKPLKSNDPIKLYLPAAFVCIAGIWPVQS
jgi:hypothetical protein